MQFMVLAMQTTFSNKIISNWDSKIAHEQQGNDATILMHQNSTNPTHSMQNPGQVLRFMDRVYAAT